LHNCAKRQGKSNLKTKEKTEMIRCQNGRFYTHGVSFTIPDGFHLETEPEFVYQFGLGAWVPDKSCYVEWTVEDNCLGTEKELVSLFQEPSNAIPLSEIQSVSVNGLSGHQVTYCKEQKFFLEVRLSLQKEAEFVFLASGERKEISTRQDVQQALNGIRPE